MMPLERLELALGFDPSQAGAFGSFLGVRSLALQGRELGLQPSLPLLSASPVGRAPGEVGGAVNGNPDCRAVSDDPIRDAKVAHHTASFCLVPFQRGLGRVHCGCRFALLLLGRGHGLFGRVHIGFARTKRGF